MYTYTVYLKKREILIKFFQCKILCNVLYSHIRVKEQDQKEYRFFSKVTKIVTSLGGRA